MRPKPRFQLRKAEFATLVQADQKPICRQIVEVQVVAIDSKKCRCHCDSDTLVAVDERMVLRQALPERRGFTSLSQSAQEFRVLVDEFIDCGEERFLVRGSALQVFDELHDGSLFLD
jgi:hypothetical protein